MADLTWFAPRGNSKGLWKKKYKGKVYYLTKAGECKGFKDYRGYEKALLRWLQKKAKLDKEESRQKPVQAIAPLAAAFASVYSDTPSLSAREKREYTLAEVVGAYLAEKRRQAESGERAVSTYREARDKLHKLLIFAGHVGVEKMEEANAQFFRAYREAHVNLPPLSNKDGKPGRTISPITARKRLSFAKTFMEWAYRNEYVEHLPRNIDRTYVGIGLPELEAIWAADGKRRLAKVALHQVQAAKDHMHLHKRANDSVQVQRGSGGPRDQGKAGQGNDDHLRPAAERGWPD